MKHFVKWLGSGVACLAILYFLLRFRTQVGAALPLLLERGNGLWLLLGCVCVPFQMSFGALAWRRILFLIGVQISCQSAIRIVFLSQLARYIPGNVGHHLGKIVLGRSLGVGVKAGGVSILIETVGVFVVGLSLSALFLPVQLKAFLMDREYVPLLIVGAIVALLLLFVLVRRGSLLVVVDKIRKFGLGLSWKERLNGAVEIGFYYLLNFLFLGLVAWLIADRVYGASDVSVLQLTGVFALSWTAGFVTPGAPAGLGVREVIALALLANSYGEEIAMGVVVLHRVVLTAGDLFAFILGLLLKWVDARTLAKSKPY